MIYRVSQLELGVILPEMEALERRCFPIDEKEALHRGMWWKIVCKGEVIAFAGLREVANEPGVGVLTRCGVARDHRGRGLQRRLVRARVLAARRMGWHTLLSTVMLDNPSSANNLAQCGFRLYDPVWHWMDVGTMYYKLKLEK
jgi:RimJ/RimL family protein N-acetyltransferase